MTTNKVFYLLSTLESELRTNHPVEAYVTLQALKEELGNDEPQYSNVGGSLVKGTRVSGTEYALSPSDRPNEVFTATKEPTK